MRQKKSFAACMAAIMAASMFMSTNALADATIAVPYTEDSAWDQVAMTNDDVVETGVYVRAAAGEDSEVIGSLYKGGAVWVISKGEEWTEVYSGGLTGFIKNDYLIYGSDSDVTGLADHYGREGVKTTWEDVKLYSGNDGGSDVLDTLQYGDSFIVSENQGHWIQVQKGADDVAYISADDVSPVILLDTAVAKDESYVVEETTGLYVDRIENQDSSKKSKKTQEAVVETPAAEETVTEEVTYEEPVYTEEPAYEESYNEDTTYEETYTEDTYTEESYVEDTYVEETYSEPASTESSSTTSLPSGIGYYENGVYYDYYGNAVYSGSESVGYYDEAAGVVYDVYGNALNYTSSSTTTEDTSSSDSYVEDTYTEDTSSSDSYVEDTSSSDSYVEESYTDNSSSAASGAGDAELLAAIIYCEAGNQSYEGMVAVGAVVMNRVASPSFPSTISDVIYQSGQFTPAYSGGLASALASGVPSACYEAAIDAMSGSNPVGGALYFNTGSGKGIKIGDHQFY